MPKVLFTHRMTHRSGPLAIRASVGFSIYPDESDEVDRLYAIADRAMYDRKPRRPEQDSPADSTDSLLSRADQS